MKKIKVDVNPEPYDILIGTGILGDLRKEIGKRNLFKNILTVVDRNVYKIYSREIDSLFDEQSGKHKILLLKTGEKLKSFESLDKIYSALIKYKFGRDSLIIAIGGGIIGDVAGYAAATYMRGIQYIQVPTTLLANVDSSVGGKTAVNFGETKNVIGAFYQPRLVLIDTEFLKSLPEEELICGIGEVVKYCFLTGESFYKYFVKNLNKLLSSDQDVLLKIISESVQFKAGVVETDEKENGLRKILNLGHTFAHAFEVEQQHKIKHGQAVILGIICALYLSNLIGIISENKLEEYLELVKPFKKFIKLSKPDIQELVDIMGRDKKNKDGKIKFVLPKNIGEMILDVEADKTVVFASIKNAINFVD